MLDWIIQHSHHPIEIEEDDYDSDDDDNFVSDEEQDEEQDVLHPPDDDGDVVADIINQEIADAIDANDDIPEAAGQNPSSPPPQPPAEDSEDSEEDITAQLCQDVTMMNHISSW